MDSIAPSSLRMVGSGLVRPECVLATSDGTLYVSDKRGGVTQIRPDGRQRLFGGAPIVPNGIALLPDGAFLASSLEREGGGVWRIERDAGGGRARPYIQEVAGVPLGPVNFVRIDRAGRTWLCVSSTEMWGETYPINAATGFIAVVDARGSRIVAEGLGFTNECVLSADERTLYVIETFSRRLTRFAVGPDGSLSGRAVVTEFAAGDYPDGLALDVEGHAWIVSVVSNRVIRVAPDGSQQKLLEDANPVFLATLEAHRTAGTLTRPLLSQARGERLLNITSIAFGGADRRTAYLGCLAGDALASFRVPVPGLEPVHWNWNFD